MKEGKRKNNVELDVSQEFPFMDKKSKDHFANIEDRWLAFKEGSEKLLCSYVQGIYDGNFNVQQMKKCNSYCALRDICRLNTVELGGEDDE